MPIRRIVVGLALAVATAFSASWLAAAPFPRPNATEPGLALAFGPGGVTVSLASPGGSVFLFGLERQRNRDTVSYFSVATYQAGSPGIAASTPSR